MWSDEKAELKRELKDTLITVAEWSAVWLAMMVLLIHVIF